MRFIYLSRSRSAEVRKEKFQFWVSGAEIILRIRSRNYLFKKYLLYKSQIGGSARMNTN